VILAITFDFQVCVELSETYENKNVNDKAAY